MVVVMAIMVVIIMVMIMVVIIMVVITNIVSTITYNACCVNVIVGTVRGPHIIILVTLVNIKVGHKVFRMLLQRLVIRWQVFSVEGGPWQVVVVIGIVGGGVVNVGGWAVEMAYQ